MFRSAERRGVVTPPPIAPWFLWSVVGADDSVGPRELRIVFLLCHSEPVRTLAWESVSPSLQKEERIAASLHTALLRCPKFPRCLTADARNFDCGHSLPSLYLPQAALGSLPRNDMAETHPYAPHREACTSSSRADRVVRPYAQCHGKQCVIGGASATPPPTNRSPIGLQ